MNYRSLRPGNSESVYGRVSGGFADRTRERIRSAVRALHSTKSVSYIQAAVTHTGITPRVQDSTSPPESLRRCFALSSIAGYAWPARTCSEQSVMRQRQRYSSSRIILWSWSLPRRRSFRRRSNCAMPSASCEREQRDCGGDSRMQAPRNSAMYCNSSDERPCRKRRAFRLSRSDAHELSAETSVAFTACLPVVCEHTKPVL